MSDLKSLTLARSHALVYLNLNQMYPYVTLKELKPNPTTSLVRHLTKSTYMLNSNKILLKKKLA